MGFVKDDDHENATLIVTEKDNALIQFFDENDNPMTLMDSGVLVPKSYADHYKIAVGDTIRIQFTDPSFANKAVEMKVAQISNLYSNPSFYCTAAYLHSFGIDYNPTSLLVKASSAADLANVRQFFEQDHQVDTIADKEDLRESAQYILKQNSFIFIMFIISAVIIALPISGYMYSIIIEALSSTHQQIPDQINRFVMLVSVILAFLLTTLSNLLLRRKVSRINMIESLKSVE